jgi:hypothetical protein
MNLGTVRVRESEDSYTLVVYVKISAESYKALYIDGLSGEVLEGHSSEKIAGKWPVVWEPK